MAIACAVAIVACFLQRDSPGIFWVPSGAVLYLSGSFLVTMRFNVPRHNVLARLNPAVPEAITVWRTVASFAASVVFMLRAFLK